MRMNFEREGIAEALRDSYSPLSPAETIRGRVISIEISMALGWIGPESRECATMAMTNQSSAPRISHSMA